MIGVWSFESISSKMSSYKLVIKGLSVYTFAFSLRDFFYFAPFARKNAYEFHAKTAKRRTQRKDKARKIFPKGLVINLIYNILDDIGFEFGVWSFESLAYFHTSSLLSASTHLQIFKLSSPQILNILNRRPMPVAGRKLKVWKSCPKSREAVVFQLRVRPRGM
jgi:hypothetical protein